MRKKNEQYKVLNRHFILFVSLVAVLLVLSVACFPANETDVALFLLISAVAVSLGIFLSPIYFVFSSKYAKTKSGLSTCTVFVAGSVANS